jgi:hypothetical protein
LESSSINSTGVFIRRGSSVERSNSSVTNDYNVLFIDRAEA